MCCRYVVVVRQGEVCEEQWYGWMLYLVVGSGMFDGPPLLWLRVGLTFVIG